MRAILISTLLVATTAHARPSGEDFERERAQLDKSLQHPAPGPGLERAAEGKPRWCQHAKRDEAWPGQIASELETYRKATNEQSALVRAAAAVCTVDDPVYHRAATELLQDWINETGLSQADAIASLAARVDEDAWSAEQEKLCSRFKFDHDDKKGAFDQTVHYALFGCSDGEPGWMSAKGDYLDPDFRHGIDRGALDHDELTRLAYVNSEVEHMLDPNAGGKVLANYAVVHYDIALVAYDAALQQLDAAPYRGNPHAKIVITETIGRTKLLIARLDAAVAKISADDRWKELIVTKPQAAADAWNAAAKKRADVLARSDKLQAALDSGGDTRNCEAPLKADILPMLKAMPHGSMEELYNAIADDPLAGLLLMRLGACLHAGADRNVADAVAALGASAVVGPRHAAYIATMRAQAEMGKHAPFSSYYDMEDFGYLAAKSSGRHDDTFDKGVVASVDKSKDGGATVKFVAERYQYTVQECKETSKADHIDPNGKIVYRQECHAAGTAWGDKAPGPMTVPAACTAGLAKGRFVYPGFDIPLQVYADAKGKKLVAAHCLPLE